MIQNPGLQDRCGERRSRPVHLSEKGNAMCDLVLAKVITTEAAFKDDMVLSNAYSILRYKDIVMKLL